MIVVATWVCANDFLHDTLKLHTTDRLCFLSDRMQTLWLLQSDDHLDLKDYVRALAKIVACRDIYKKAWHDLALHLRGRLSDPSTRDPVETILPIVERLAGTES